MDYNQKKTKAKEEIAVWIGLRTANTYAPEVIEKKNNEMKKLAKQFGLTKDEIAKAI